MSNPRTITVNLPDCMVMSDDDMHVLRTTLQTIITLSSGDSRGPDTNLTAMRKDGWTVNWDLTWIARARRDGVYEEATAETKDQVMEQLARLVRLHEVEGTP